MDDSDLRNLRDFRRFELDDDYDLEALQEDFLKSGSKPAAKIVRGSQQPSVVSSDDPPVKNPAKAPDTINASASSSDILDFAKNMANAIKEFEIKEKSTAAHPIEDTPAPSSASALPSKPKKLSLFAQRRLAKQNQAGSTPSQQPQSANSKEHTAATFLPKLMAPVPEHELTEPIRPPQIKPRETGFPAIPVDFAANDSVSKASSAETAANTLANSLRGNDYWADVRQQVSQENEDRIKGMSREEIAEAQSEIRAMFSSDTIKRLQQRKAKPKAPLQDTPTESKSSQATKQVRFAEAAQTPGDSEDSAGLVPPPPPPAEWVDAEEPANSDAKTPNLNVDDNSTGADSKFYQEAKRRLYPSEAVEDAQMAWIMGHKQAKSPMEMAVSESQKQSAQAASKAAAAGTEDDLMAKPAAHIRFAFDGQILGEEDADIPTNIGLHHHGEDADKPGYTIPELLHLSRSTVSGQRSVSMATLGNIIHKINAGAWDAEQAASVYICLLDWQTELYLAHGLRDANKTARVETVIALWTWVVEMFKYKALVRLATGGEVEMADSAIPGADIKMTPKPVTVKGVLIERTFAAFDSMVTSKFMDTVYENISMSLMPERQLVMLAECVKALEGMSQEFGDRIKSHGKLSMLLQNKYAYLSGP
ncbi:hypothetical protein EV183_003090 [Coemansia sp. RSA 2336]|nr:hypothetical protein EV183_003090 [Coemansia sp. RSA 2336]